MRVKKKREQRTEERARNQCRMQQEMRKYRWKGGGRANESASKQTGERRKCKGEDRENLAQKKAVKCKEVHQTMEAAQQRRLK